MEKQEKETRNTPAHLFTIRVWSEEIEDGIREWRGKVQNVSTEEGHYFHGWNALIELLHRLVSEDQLEE
ncbi:MAG: hypothetical protein ABFS17_01335 [Chloroflexota bacterium]